MTLSDLLVGAVLAIFAGFALLLAYEGLRPAAPRSIPASRIQIAFWSMFQIAVVFGIVWMVTEPPKDPPAGSWTLAAAVAFFATFVVLKCAAFGRWLLQGLRRLATKPIFQRRVLK